MSDENIQKALCDIDNICCIYRSVGEALYDEVRMRLAGRFGKRLDDLTARLAAAEATQKKDCEVLTAFIVGLQDRNADQSQRLAAAEAEREQYRMLAVSYGKTLRVSEASVDSIVTARLAQKRAAKGGNHETK